MRTVGLRVKSGYAVAVVLAGDCKSWSVESRADVMLTGADDHYARFPYHALIELDEQEGQRTHQRALAAIRSAAQTHMDALLHSIGRIDCAAIVGSTADPDAIGNPHMRMHALEGRLFRGVTAQALAKHRIRCVYLSDKNAYADVAQAVRCSEPALREGLLRRPGAVKPWRGEEKLASLGALLAMVPLPT